MPTQHVHRLHLVVPTSRCAALNAWVRANLDPTGADWFTPTLSATGLAPYTHAECSVSLTDAEGKKLLTRLATVSGIQAPADWDSRTRAAKKAWLASQRAAIDSAIGVLVTGMDNDGVWADPASSRAEKSLTRRLAYD